MPSAFSPTLFTTEVVPAGCVVAFAGASAPSGWLLCDGSAISRTTYSKLFAAVSTAHGSGDGSTTFHLPNYAGRFLRGRANGSANDPDRASRTAANSGGNTGDNVGSVQTPQTAVHSLSGTASAGVNLTHSHGLIKSGTNGGLGGVNICTFSSDTYNTSGGSAPPYVQNSGTLDHSHSLSLSGGNETRPINAYVNYIIKI